MSKKYVTDMTSGNEIALLIKFTIPMLLGNLFQQFYNLADTVIVGQFGGEYGLASIGAVGSVNFLFFSLCIDGYWTLTWLFLLVFEHVAAGGESGYGETDV